MIFTQGNDSGNLIDAHMVVKNNCSQILSLACGDTINNHPAKRLIKRSYRFQLGLVLYYDLVCQPFDTHEKFSHKFNHTSYQIWPIDMLQDSTLGPVYTKVTTHV